MSTTAMLSAVSLEGSDPGAIRGGCRRWVDEKTEGEKGRLETYMGQTKLLASLDVKVPSSLSSCVMAPQEACSHDPESGGQDPNSGGSWRQARATVVDAFEKKVYVKDDDIITQVPAHPSSSLAPTHLRCVLPSPLLI